MRWPVHLETFGSVEAGALLWAQRGALNVTVISKTAFALAAGARVTLPPDPVDPFDRHHGDDPTRAIRTPSDVVIRLPMAEIFHAGAVVAPAGVTMVHLSIAREGRKVLDHRALAKRADDSTGLGPQRRTTHVPPTDRNGVVVLPDDHDFRTEQRAPAELRLDRLMGGDVITLGNLHPDVPELGVSLPSRAPAARAILGGEEAPLTMSCQRALFDTDRRVVTLTWLAELELPGLEAVPHLRVEIRAADAPPAPRQAPVAGAAPFDPRDVLRRIAATPARNAPSGPPPAPSAPPPAPSAPPPPHPDIATDPTVFEPVEEPPAMGPNGTVSMGEQALPKNRIP